MSHSGGGQPSRGGMADVLGGLMGGSAQGNAPSAGAGSLGALLPVVIGMLANSGQGSGQGGLGGLMEKFNQAGLGDVLGSWIGSGQNTPIGADQLGRVLGRTARDDRLADRHSQGEAAGQLAQALPGLIDEAHPARAPAGGFGNAGELMGMLGGLIQK